MLLKGKKAKHMILLFQEDLDEEILGEGGVKLSGGQRQKIAVRAFYKNLK